MYQGRSISSSVVPVSEDSTNFRPPTEPRALRGMHGNAKVSPSPSHGYQKQHYQDHRSSRKPPGSDIVVVQGSPQKGKDKAKTTDSGKGKSTGRNPATLKP